MRRLIHVLCVLMLYPAATALAAGPRVYVDPRTNALNKNDPPFSGSVKVGDTLYISGQIGLGPDRKPPAEVADEAKLVMEAVKNQLVKQGMTMDDLVSVQVFLDCADFACTKQRLDAAAHAKGGGVLYQELFVRHWDTWSDGRRSQLFAMTLDDVARVQEFYEAFAGAPLHLHHVRDDVNGARMAGVDGERASRGLFGTTILAVLLQGERVHRQDARITGRRSLPCRQHLRDAIAHRAPPAEPEVERMRDHER